MSAIELNDLRQLNVPEYSSQDSQKMSSALQLQNLLRREFSHFPDQIKSPDSVKECPHCKEQYEAGREDAKQEMVASERELQSALSDLLVTMKKSVSEIDVLRGELHAQFIGLMLSSFEAILREQITPYVAKEMHYRLAALVQKHKTHVLEIIHSPECNDIICDILTDFPDCKISITEDKTLSGHVMRININGAGILIDMPALMSSIHNTLIEVLNQDGVESYG